MESRPSKFDLIDDKSDELHEIIGKKPKWVIQWGSSFAFVFVILLLILGYAIKYPDVIKADIIVTKSNPPIRLYARASGNIQFKVKGDQYVKESDVLVILMNSGESQDLLELSNQLEAITDSVILSGEQIDFSSDLNLGEFQSFHSNFLNDYNQYQLLITLEPNENEIENLLSKKKASESIIQELDHRIGIAKRKLEILEKDLSRNQKLFDQNVISEKDLEDKQSIVIDQKDFIQSLVLDQSIERRLLIELESELTKVNYLKIDDLQKAKQNLANSFRELKSGLSRWKHMFTVSAPIDGRVSFINAWTSNQYIQKGEEVIAIVPKGSSSKYLGILNMPLANSGKVNIGQRVNISLKTFPDHQYGILVGKIDNISDVANKEKYQVVVELPEQLYTSYKISLPLKEEYLGTAEIVTDDLRLIERLLNRLRRKLSDY